MRRNIFKWNTIAILLLVVFFQTTRAEEKKYPPYPDVWGIELPVAESVDYAGIDVVKMPDGDIMVVYISDWKELKSRKAKDFDPNKDIIRKHRGFLIFASKEIKFTPDDEYYDFIKKMREEGRVLGFHAPSRKVEVITEEDRIKRLTDPSNYGSGISEEGGGARTEDCNPLDGYLVMLNKDGKLSRKKLLYVYSKPVKRIVDSTCEGTETYNKEFYYERVHFLEEMTHYSLEDDTFLFVGFLKNQSPPSVVVIRFAREFKTKSDLINKKVFVVDEEEYEKITYKLDNQVKGDQAMYNYLIKIQKGGKK